MDPAIAKSKQRKSEIHKAEYLFNHPDFDEFKRQSPQMQPIDVRAA